MAFCLGVNHSFAGIKQADLCAYQSARQREVYWQSLRTIGMQHITGAKPRVFLFLQGPHGPFFNRLGADAACRAGANGLACWLQFAAMSAFWFDHSQKLHSLLRRCVRMPGRKRWRSLLDAEKGVTDLAFFTATRVLIHARSRRLSHRKANGIAGTRLRRRLHAPILGHL